MSRYKFDEETDKGLLFRAMKIDALDLDDFVTESVSKSVVAFVALYDGELQRFYPSKDGTL